VHLLRRSPRLKTGIDHFLRLKLDARSQAKTALKRCAIGPIASQKNSH
jgi:hypothetical protein